MEPHLYLPACQSVGALQGIATVAQLSSGLPFKLTKCPAVQQALREWHSLHPGSKQQDGAEFCTVVLAKMVGIQWGTYDARCQFDVPEKHALHQPILLSQSHSKSRSKLSCLSGMRTWASCRPWNRGLKSCVCSWRDAQTSTPRIAVQSACHRRRSCFLSSQERDYEWNGISTTSEPYSCIKASAPAGATLGRSCSRARKHGLLMMVGCRPRAR